MVPGEPKQERLREYSVVKNHDEKGEIKYGKVCNGVGCRYDQQSVYPV